MAFIRRRTTKAGTISTIGWDKRPPAPELPPDITAKTTEKYEEARARLVGDA